LAKPKHINVTPPPGIGGKIPREVVEKQVIDARNTLVTFSFRFLEIRPTKFCPTLAGTNYLKAFVERLKAICGLTLDDVRLRNLGALRCHPIRWIDTSEPEGFQHLPPDVDDSQPWQLQISSNKHGRLHGFFTGSLFHLVWMDPEHLLYPGKK